MDIEAAVVRAPHSEFTVEPARLDSPRDDEVLVRASGHRYLPHRHRDRGADPASAHALRARARGSGGRARDGQGRKRPGEGRSRRPDFHELRHLPRLLVRASRLLRVVPDAQFRRPSRGWLRHGARCRRRASQCSVLRSVVVRNSRNLARAQCNQGAPGCALEVPGRARLRVHDGRGNGSQRPETSAGGDFRHLRDGCARVCVAPGCEDHGLPSHRGSQIGSRAASSSRGSSARRTSSTRARRISIRNSRDSVASTAPSTPPGCRR